MRNVLNIVKTNLTGYINIENVINLNDPILKSELFPLDYYQRMTKITMAPFCKLFICNFSIKSVIGIETYCIEPGV